MIHVRFLERPECGLCDEAMAALRRLSRRRPLDIERINIAGDPVLLDRYIVRVPMLIVGEAELDVAGIDDAAIGRWLDEVAG